MPWDSWRRASSNEQRLPSNSSNSACALFNTQGCLPDVRNSTSAAKLTGKTTQKLPRHMSLGEFYGATANV